MRKPALVADRTSGLATGASAALAQGGQEDPNATDSGGAIMVWLDPPREAAAEPFMEAYPDIPFEWNPVAQIGTDATLQQQFETKTTRLAEVEQTLAGIEAELGETREQAQQTKQMLADKPVDWQPEQPTDFGSLFAQKVTLTCKPAAS